MSVPACSYCHSSLADPVPGLDCEAAHLEFWNQMDEQLERLKRQAPGRCSICGDRLFMPDPNATMHPRCASGRVDEWIDQDGNRCRVVGSVLVTVRSAESVRRDLALNTSE